MLEILAAVFSNIDLLAGFSSSISVSCYIDMDTTCSAPRKQSIPLDVVATTTDLSTTV